MRALQDLGVSLVMGAAVPAGVSGFIEDVDLQRARLRVNFGAFHGGSRWVKQADVKLDPEENT